MMSASERILTDLSALLPTLRSRFGIASLALFGSAARGQATPTSDIDLLVSFLPGTPVTLLTFARLKTELESALGISVDLVEDHAALRPAFRAAMHKDMLRVA